MQRTLKDVATDLHNRAAYLHYDNSRGAVTTAYVLHLVDDLKKWAEELDELEMDRQEFLNELQTSVEALKEAINL